MRSARTLFVGVVLFGVAVVAPVQGSDPVPPAESPDSARASVAKWVETQQILAKEKSDWQQGKEILQSRIELVKSEIASLRQKLDELNGTGREAQKKTSELSAQDASLKAASAELETWVSELEGRLRRLDKTLPEPVRTKVSPLYGRMPADPSHTNISLAERFQNVVGILNEVSKFNNEISLVSEVRTLSDAKPAEVKTVYVGLAGAYYVSTKGEAGVGTPAVASWRWAAQNDLAPQILQVVEILQSKAKPAFIPLPVKIQ